MNIKCQKCKSKFSIGILTLALVGIIIIMCTKNKMMTETFLENSKVKKIEKHVKNGHIVILMVHAKWCGYCKKLKPIWTNLKNDVKKANEKKVKFLKIEDVEKDELKELKKKFGFELEFFPTILKITKKGEFEQFNGKNIKSKITTFIRK